MHCFYVVQHQVLDMLHCTDPKAKWWIKEDGTDLKECLQESKQKAWNGDIDKNDGKLQVLYSKYTCRLISIQKLLTVKACDNICALIKELVQFLEEDHAFLSTSLPKAITEYRSKLNNKNCSEDKLKKLNWNVIELTTLVQQSLDLKQDLSNALDQVLKADLVHNPTFEGHVENLRTYSRNVFKKMREPGASHVLVFLLSSEKRDKKPYALPIQYHLYNTLTDAEVRQAVEDIKHVMHKKGMICKGTTQ